MVTHPRANHGPKLRDHTRTGVYCRSVHQLGTYINMRPNWSTSVGFGSVDFRKQNEVGSKGIIKRKKNSVKMFAAGQNLKNKQIIAQLKCFLLVRRAL